MNAITRYMPWNRGQIGIKLRTKHVIYHVLKILIVGALNKRGGPHFKLKSLIGMVCNSLKWLAQIVLNGDESGNGWGR